MANNTPFQRLIVPAIVLSLAGLPGAAVAQQSQGTETEAPAASAPATDEGSDAAAAEAPAIPVEPAKAETVLATVNGKDITLGQLIVMRQSLPDQYQQLPDEVLSPGLLDQLVDIAILANAAEADGVDKSDTVTLRMTNERRSILAMTYMRRAIDARITEEEIAALYKTEYLDKPKVEEVRAGHILVPEKEAADKLKAQLDGGADFAALAAEHGTDGTASRGGDLGWFVHSDMVPEFADAVFDMEAGQVSEPVQTPFGWHLIKLEERRDRQPPALDEVRSDLVTKLTETVSAEVMEGLRANAKVERVEGVMTPADIRKDDLVAQ